VSEATWNEIVQALAQDQFVVIADSCVTGCSC
jgi:hypothetical protein